MVFIILRLLIDSSGTNLLQKLTNTYGEVVEEYYYTYDNNKNIIRKTEKGKLFAYTYDALNRIKTISEVIVTTNEEGIEEETPILLTTYSYDKVGNRTKEMSKNLNSLVGKIEDYIEYLKTNKEFITKFYDIGDGLSVSYKNDEKK